MKRSGSTGSPGDGDDSEELEAVAQIRSASKIRTAEMCRLTESARLRSGNATAARSCCFKLSLKLVLRAAASPAVEDSNWGGWEWDDEEKLEENDHQERNTSVHNPNAWLPDSLRDASH